MKALAPEILIPSLVQNMARPSQKSALEELLLVAIYIPIPTPKRSFAQST